MPTGPPDHASDIEIATHPPEDGYGEAVEHERRQPEEG
jgi:hypothetical protein